MDHLARSFRWLALALLACVCATGRGQQNSVSVVLTNAIAIQGETQVVAFSIPFHLVAAPAYVYTITGNVHGEGPSYSKLIPTSEPVSTALEAIHQGLSSALQGTVSNPGGALPAAVVNEQVSSGTDGAFNATFSISLDATGIVTFGITNVAIENVNGQPDTTDRIVFDSGDVTVTALFADVSVATLSATNVTTEGITLRSSIICPHPFEAYFIYGTGTSSLSGTSTMVSVAASGTAQIISIPVTGLLPHQVYYYRSAGQDVTGPAYGGLAAFKTKDVLPVAGTVSAYAGLTPLTIPVLASASDSDGAALKVTAVSGGTAGRPAVMKGGQAVTYHFTSKRVKLDQFAYTVADPYGGSAVGEVNVVNYAALAGMYFAVLLNPATQNTGSGSVRITLAATGQCTGTVTIGGVAYSFNGALDSSGHLATTVKAAGAPYGITITLDMVPSGNRYAMNAGVSMNGLYLQASAPAAVVGGGASYTMLMPPPQGTAYAGTGYALVQVASSGVAAISGALSDGAAFSCQSVVDSTGRAGVFALLYGTTNRGSLAGTLALSGLGQTVISGTLIWTKPALATAGINQGPFTIALTGSGGQYVPPAHAAALQFGTAGNTGQVALSGGNLNTPIQNGVSIASNNVVSILGLGSNHLSLAIQAGTGLFTGKFLDPLNGATRTVQGVVVQEAQKGGGWFLGDSASGSVGMGP